MIDTPTAAGRAEASWPHPTPRPRVPDTSMLPGGEKPAPLSDGPLFPHAEGAGDAKTRLTGGTPGRWSEGLRVRVLTNPLVALAVAVALGVVVGRLTR